MSLSNTNIASGPYTTNGSTTDFPVTFKFLSNDEVLVYKITTATGAYSTLVLDSDYTLTGANVDAGGTCTISPALASGYTIYIVRNLPLSQLVDIVNQGTFYASVVEGAYDRLAMVDQMLMELINRCYKADPGETPGTLSDAVEDIKLEHIPKTMFGEAQTGLIFGKFVAPCDGYIEALVLEAYGGPPVGQNLICKVSIDTVEEATDFILSSGSYYERTAAATTTTIFVAEGEAVTLAFEQVGTTYPGTNVTATIQFRRNI